MVQPEAQNCQTDLIAAYVDGELDASTSTTLEAHLLECSSCQTELRNQRLFMCELDSALADELHMAVPRDFARIVAAQAESDMSGARSGTEHKRALRYCLVLTLASFALLGVAAGKSLIFSAQFVGSRFVGLVSFLGKLLYDAGESVIVILRIGSQALLPDGFSILVLLILLLAVLLLSLLISSYHRRGLYD